MFELLDKEGVDVASGESDRYKGHVRFEGTFIIAHRLSTIRNADQILVMDHGRIMERGDHDQLMQAEGLYHQMHKLQSS